MAKETHLRGYVSDLSPIKTTNPPLDSDKKPTTYFTGRFQIGTREYKRMVCFDGSKHAKCHAAKETQEHVELTKYGEKGDEVKLFKSSKITLREDKPRFEFKPCVKTGTIAEIKDYDDDDMVNVVAKITNIGQISNSGSPVGRDVTITDKTGSMTVRLWEAKLETLSDKNGKVCAFNNLKVRVFQRENTLNLTPETSVDVLEDSDLKDVVGKVAANVSEIVVIDACDVQESLHCKCRELVKDPSGTFYKCNKCSLRAKCSKLVKRKRIRVVSDSGKTYPIPVNALPAEKQGALPDEIEMYILETEKFTVATAGGIVTSFVPAPAN